MNKTNIVKGKKEINNQQNKIDNIIKIIIIACIILSSLSLSYYLLIFLPKKDVDNLERLQNEKFIEEQKAIQKAKALEDLNEESSLNLSICLGEAEDDYWEYMKINGKENKDGTIYALNEYWDRAEKNRKEAKDYCFKQYPQN